MSGQEKNNLALKYHTNDEFLLKKLIKSNETIFDSIIKHSLSGDYHIYNDASALKNIASLESSEELPDEVYGLISNVLNYIDRREAL
ncbi:MAG: hypothetical protein NT007_15635 [Candidatus Kapabacteria bacterium]|nr:hypothetical protein [Candidatus Kapabacteria bacterium]